MSEAVSTALQTGLTGLGDDLGSVIVIIIPIALGVAASIFGIKKALSWFKSLAK